MPRPQPNGRVMYDDSPIGVANRSARRWRTATASLAAAVAVAAAIWGVVEAYGDQRVEHDRMGRTVDQHDAMIQTDRARYRDHVQRVETRFLEIEQRLRNLGALQIEQGEEQRRILLQIAPRQVRRRHRKKPPKLREAEARVLRD